MRVWRLPFQRPDRYAGARCGLETARRFREEVAPCPFIINTRWCSSNRPLQRREQLVSKFLAVEIAVFRLLTHSAGQDLAGLHAVTLVDFNERMRLREQVRGEEAGRRVAIERQPAREPLVDDDCQGVLIGPAIDRLAFDGFGRHVGGRAQGHARLGLETHAGEHALRTFDRAEVGQAGRPVRVEEDVGRLDVAMHKALGMKIVQCGCNLRQPLVKARVLPGLQVAAAQVLHHGEGTAFVLDHIRHLDDVRMVEPSHGEHLGRKAALHIRVVTQHARPEGLEHDTPARSQVRCQKHLAHPAFAEFLFDMVAVVDANTDQPWICIGRHGSQIVSTKRRENPGKQGSHRQNACAHVPDTTFGVCLFANIGSQN